jgi:hypothetical protein
VSGKAVRVPSGSDDGVLRELTGLMRELVEVQKENTAHVKRTMEYLSGLAYVMKGQFQDVLDGFQYVLDAERDEIDYDEWLEDMEVGELAAEVEDLEVENEEFLVFLRERAKNGEGVENVADNVVASGSG